MNIDFAALFTTSPNPYVVLDPELRIVEMNDAYLRATMREREDIIGRPMFEAFPSDPLSESYRLLRSSLVRVFETGQRDELALIRYDIRNPDGGMDVRLWSATHTPLPDRDGRIAHVLQHTVDVTELHGLRTLRDNMGIVERATAVQARNLDLAEESQQLKTLFEQAPGFVAVLSGPDHRFQMANAAYRRLVGERDIIGRPVAEALPEVVGQGFVGLLDQVRASATAYVGLSEKILLRNDDASQAQERFLDFLYQPILAASGAVSGIFVQGHDVTDQKIARERQKLLIGELNHRVKNTLAIVQGLAAQSFKPGGDYQLARRNFDARLNALAAAHGLLTGQSSDSARLAGIVGSSVEAAAGSEANRFVIHGPDIELDPQASLSMAMIVHELSTNAIKYGALSDVSGQVDVGWTVVDEDDRRRLTIDWIESGGPPVSPPARRGFGTRLIQGGLSGEHRCEVDMIFDPAGLRCRIVASLPSAG